MLGLDRASDITEVASSSHPGEVEFKESVADGRTGLSLEMTLVQLVFRQLRQIEVGYFASLADSCHYRVILY